MFLNLVLVSLFFLNINSNNQNINNKNETKDLNNLKDLKEVDATFIKTYYDNKNYDFVINIGETINLNNKKPFILKILSKSYLKTHNYELARSRAREAIYFEPSWNEAYKIISYAYFKENNFDKSYENIKVWELNHKKPFSLKEEYFLAEIYKRKNIDAEKHYKNIIKKLEKDSFMYEHKNMYLDSLIYLKDYEKAIRFIKTLDETCSNLKLLSNISIKAHMPMDKDFFKKFKYKCLSQTNNELRFDSKTTVSHINITNLDFFKLSSGSTISRNNISANFLYSYNNFNNDYSNEFSILGLSFNYLYKNNYDFELGIAPHIGFKNKYFPFHLAFSYYSKTNNFYFKYSNNTIYYKTLSFAQNNFQTKDLSIGDIFIYKNIFELEYSFNYMQLSETNNNYANIFDSYLKISSNLIKNNPFSVGLVFNSFNLDTKSNDIKNIIIDNRFIYSLYWEYSSRKDYGFNITSIILVGADASNSVSFSEIMDLSIIPSYVFNENYKLELDISYYTVTEAIELDDAFSTMLSLNYSY